MHCVCCDTSLVTSIKITSYFHYSSPSVGLYQKGQCSFTSHIDELCLVHTVNGLWFLPPYITFGQYSLQLTLSI